MHSDCLWPCGNPAPKVTSSKIQMFPTRWWGRLQEQPRAPHFVNANDIHGSTEGRAEPLHTNSNLSRALCPIPHMKPCNPLRFVGSSRVADRAGRAHNVHRNARGAWLRPVRAENYESKPFWQQHILVDPSAQSSYSPKKLRHATTQTQNTCACLAKPNTMTTNHSWPH